MQYFAHKTAVVDKGAQIGRDTKIWHWSHISEGAVIGDNCVFGQNVYVANKVLIGKNVKVQNNVSVYDNVVLEDDVFCGPSCVFTNVKNPRSAVNRRGEYSLTKVSKGVSIGANATIVCGVTLGEYSFVGAGSTITKDTKPFSINVGSPAKQIGWMSKHGERIEFEEGEYLCIITHEKYVLKGNNVFIEPSS